MQGNGIFEVEEIKKITDKENCKYLDLEAATFSRWKKTRPQLYGVVKNYFRIISAASLVDMSGLAAVHETVTAITKIQKEIPNEI